jgi:hypothetical protein
MQLRRNSSDPNAGAGTPDLIDSKTAARLLGLRNHHTLEVWRSVGRHASLPYYKVGRAVRYRRGDIEAFLRAHLIGHRESQAGGDQS